VGAGHRTYKRISLNRDKVRASWQREMGGRKGGGNRGKKGFMGGTRRRLKTRVKKWGEGQVKGRGVLRKNGKKCKQGQWILVDCRCKKKPHTIFCCITGKKGQNLGGVGTS